MTNPRDTGRWDAIAQEYVDTNVQIDFAWGNIPIQPNDDRGMAQLDPELDSHIIATSGYVGFPAHQPGYPNNDTITNVAVPNVVGLSASAAQNAIAAAGLDYSTSESEDGANSGNDGTVKSQSPAAGTMVNVSSDAGDTTVSLIIYNNPAVIVPSVVDFDSVSAAEAYLIAEGLVLGTVTTSSVGATSQNNNWVKSQSPAAGTTVAPGTAVNLVKYVYTAPINYNIAGIRSHVDGNTRRTLYLNGRNSGITVGSMIQLSNTGVANYDRIFDVLTVENDDAFNTGGQKLTITNGLMTADGGDVTNTGTWAVYP